MSLVVFSSTLNRLSPFHLVLCCCFKAMLFVGIVPNKASFVCIPGWEWAVVSRGYFLQTRTYHEKGSLQASW